MRRQMLSEPVLMLCRPQANRLSLGLHLCHWQRQQLRWTPFSALAVRALRLIAPLPSFRMTAMVSLDYSGIVTQLGTLI
jgi:hypothetical protein